MNEKKKQILIKVLIASIILFGICIRLINIADFPNALNCDEASEGYEAFSILKYGIDRNGNHLPVFLKSWGGGQNILLAWMMIPFILLFGLSTLIIRLPMAILSCIALIVFYFLMKRITNRKTAIIGLFFLAICPWHIMKSRWALESNIFPDIILIATYLLIVGLQDKKKWLYYISFALYGLSVYAYGTSYMFLPIFLIVLLITLIIKKIINWKQAILSILISTIVALPIILYVLINTFNLPQINLPFMTIPKLDVNRYTVVTSIYSSNIVLNCLGYFISSLKIIITGYDGLEWNSIMPYGLFYPISILIAVIGIYKSFKKKSDIEYSYIFNIWLIVSLLLCFVVEPNINRINILVMAIIYFITLGLGYIINISKTTLIITYITYIIFFVFFIKAYFAQDYDKYLTFQADLKEVIEYIDEKDKNIVITNRIKEPSIYVLFYTKYNTKNYSNTVDIYNRDKEYMIIKSFGKYSFKNIDQIDELDNDTIYVLTKDEYEKNNFETEKIKEFERYVVIGETN